MIKYSVVVPAYNSSDSLVELMLRIHKVFCETIRQPYEVIIVDDGSSQASTWQTMKELVVSYPTVKIFQLTKNFGKTSALICGLKAAVGQYIFYMDDDLQHCPEDFPAFIENDDHDVVIALFEERKGSRFSRMVSALAHWVERKFSVRPEHFKNSPFKMIKKDIVTAILSIDTSTPDITGLLCSVTDDIVNITVKKSERVYGSSGFTYKKKLKKFCNHLFANPASLFRKLIIACMLMVLTIFSLCIYVFIKKSPSSVTLSFWGPVFLFVALAILFILILWIIGELLIRLVHNVESRPCYVVRKSFDSSETVRVCNNVES